MDYAQYYLDLKKANKKVSSTSDVSDGHTIHRQKNKNYDQNPHFDQGIVGNYKF